MNTPSRPTAKPARTYPSLGQWLLVLVLAGALVVSVFVVAVTIWNAPRVLATWPLANILFLIVTVTLMFTPLVVSILRHWRGARIWFN
jgi:hypothetical protein